MKSKVYNLIADIGGTNARFALAEPNRDSMCNLRHLHCADYPSLQDALHAYLQPISVMIDRAVISIAGPVSDGAVLMTNHHWQINIADIGEHFGWQSLQVVNDFTALSLSLPFLKQDSYIAIGRGEAKAQCPIAVIGPGTGLGVSAVVPLGDRWIPIESQGGHVGYGALNEFETRILDIIHEDIYPVTAETLVSGPGLSLLYKTICRIETGTPIVATPAEVSQLAVDSDPHAVTSLSLLCEILGTIASNLALTLGARGGVFIGGGILPRIPEFFMASGFRQRFEQQGKMNAYLQHIPTFIVTAENSALSGAMQILNGDYDWLGFTSHLKT